MTARGVPAVLADRADRPGRRPVADPGAARAGGGPAGAALRLQGHRPARRQDRQGAPAATARPARWSSASTASTSPTPSSRRWCRWSTRSPRRWPPSVRMNTVLLRGGRTVGHNTDVSGFRRSFTDGLPDADRERVVLIGAGGAGTAVAHALGELGVGRLLVVDPDPGRASALAATLQEQDTKVELVPATRAELADAVAGSSGLVNASPVGMAAHPGSPVPAELLRRDLWLADIVYRPLDTALLAAAREAGCSVLSGAGMAVHQAADAFELITGRPADRGAMLRDFDELVEAEASTHKRKEPMMALRKRGRSAALVACLVALPMGLAACGDDDDEGGGGGDDAGGSVTLQLAHSYTETQPQHRCGAQVIADEVEKADVGVTIEIFPASQLGGDADRIASVVSGDIDIDIQGASALGAVYEPVSVLDAAYAFDDSDHLARFFDDDASDGPAPGLRGRDRRAHARSLVGRHAPVHGQRADPEPGRPRRAADAVPGLPAVPHERRGAGGRGDRGGLRGAVPGPPAGHRRRPGEPDHQHRGQQPAGRAGLHQHVQPPGQLQPGDHRRRPLGRALVGAAGRPHRGRRRGRGAGARLRRRGRGGDARRVGGDRRARGGRRRRRGGVPHPGGRVPARELRPRSSSRSTRPSGAPPSDVGRGRFRPSRVRSTQASSGRHSSTSTSSSATPSST